MATPESKPAVELLPSLLEKIDVLFFAGEQDAMCNWLGGESDKLYRCSSLNFRQWKEVCKSSSGMERPALE